MLRKIVVGCLILTFALSLLSGCAKESKPAAGSGDGSTAVSNTVQTQENQTEASKIEGTAPPSKPQISVKAPEGWSTNEDSAALAHYMNGMASFIVTCDTVPAGINSPDEYVKYAQEQYQKTFPDAVFTETKKITVDGVEGRDYSFAYSVSGMKMKTRIVYLIKDSQAYTLTCGTLEEEFDQTADDFQGMIEAFKMP